MLSRILGKFCFENLSTSFTSKLNVQVFNEAVKLALKAKEEPEDVVMAEIMRLLQEDDNAGARTGDFNKTGDSNLDTTAGSH